MDGCIYFYPKLARPRSQRKEGRKEGRTYAAAGTSAALTAVAGGSGSASAARHDD
jgi:hypothetical protein